MEKSQGAAGSTLKPFAIGYLVWHCLNMLVTLCLLGYVSVKFFSYAEWPALTMPVLGISVSVFLLLILGWAFTILVALAGVLFALGSIGVWKIPRNKVHAVGMALLAICTLELVLGIIQGNVFTLLSKAISILLAGAILHELAPHEKREAQHREPTGRGTGPSDSVDDGAIEAEPIAKTPTECASTRASDGSPSTRHLIRMCEGYSLIMFFWGALRLLTGLAEIFNGGFSTSDDATVQRVVSGCVLAGVGIYLIAVGRYGKASVKNQSKLRLFRTLSIVGLCVSVGSVVPTIIWTLRGAALSTGDLFCSSIDLMLYAAGVYYARKLALVGEARSAR